MPDDNQIPNPKPQTPNVQGDQGQVQPVVQPTIQPTPQQVPPAQPVTVPTGKESAPASNAAPLQIEKPPEQWVEETAAEAKIEEELQKVGVEATKTEVLQVSPEASQAGVKPMGTAVPIPTEPTVKFPMTEEKARGIVKMHRKVRDSLTWLAMLVLRQFQVLQVNQKKP